MGDVFFALSGILVILLISEVLWRLKIVRGEYARKFVHIAAGSFIAFWPWFMPWRTIQVLSLALLFVVILSKSFNIFHAIHDIKRKTYGEEMFAIGIFLSSILTDVEWMFCLAILTMTLSDGLAAVLGTAYGEKTRYKIFGSVKSWAGNMAFFITTLLLFVGLAQSGLNGEKQMVYAASIPVALALTGIETLSVKGTDNILIPVATILILRLITM